MWNQNHPSNCRILLPLTISSAPQEACSLLCHRNSEGIRKEEWFSLQSWRSLRSQGGNLSLQGQKVCTFGSAEHMFSSSTVLWSMKAAVENTCKRARLCSWSTALRKVDVGLRVAPRLKFADPLSKTLFLYLNYNDVHSLRKPSTLSQ